MDKIFENILKEISALPHENMAHSLRINGKGEKLKSSENISIVPKPEGNGIEVHVKANTKNESLHIPVIISQSGLTDLVYNDFFIDHDVDITIVAGCAIHNPKDKPSEHNGIHTFHVGENSKVKYFEKHYGEGAGSGKRILNPTTKLILGKNSSFNMNSSQIKGVSNSIRATECVLHENASLIIIEKIFTNGNFSATTKFTVLLEGDNSSVHVVSRAVAENTSTQFFESKIAGNAKCFGHVECDAIIKDNAKVVAIPAIEANNVNANLIHEAAIGKIAGEQILKLMTLGLSEKEAEEAIITGFLK